MLPRYGIYPDDHQCYSYLDPNNGESPRCFSYRGHPGRCFFLVEWTPYSILPEFFGPEPKTEPVQ